MKVIFKKIYNNHKRLRDDEIVGETAAWPKVGEQFKMVAPPRDAGDIRYVCTSPVTELSTEILLSQKSVVTLITFKTKSGSIYSVEETAE